MNKLFLFCAAASTVLLMETCAVNPVTGKKQVVLMSEAQELQMGKEADPQIIAQYGLYEDKELQDFISVQGKKMAAVSHRPNIEYQFRVVDSEVVNAFAIPGYVYFTRGILAHFNNEAEFAGVLGHEIGHITARHTVSQQTKSTLAQVGLIAGMIVSPEFAQFGETASQGLGLMLLKFGRDAERQSDELGVEYSSKIGYDASEMAGFFNTLQRKGEESGSEELPSFLSTHPSPADRNVTVGQLATKWKQQLNLTNPVVNRNTYLKRIDGLIYGEDPKQGFLENSVFYHPVLKMQWSVPQGWSYQNTPQAVQVAPKDGNAMMMMTFAPGKSLQEAGNAVTQKYSLRVVESRETTVNGLPALAFVADQVQQNQSGQQQAGVRTLSYIIQYGGAYYHLIGVSSPQNFNRYSQAFTSSMNSFRPLTDASKLNKKPDRVRIKTVKSAATLQQALKSFNVTDKRLQELAVLNGMQLNDRVTAGMMIKVIEQ